MNIEELKEMKRKIEYKYILEEKEKESVRDMVIRKYKQNHNKEPTEEEINADLKYIDKVKKNLLNRYIIPIVGPDAEAEKKNE